jgi:TonB family protein
MTSERNRKNEVGFVTVFTMVVWIVCLIVGAVGLLTPPAHPRAPTTEPAPPPPLEVLNVDMSAQPVAQVIPPDVAKSVPAAPALAAAPPLPAVALPSPSISFEQPVEGPVRIVSAVQANPALVAPGNSADVPWLTSDEGLDNLPQLGYPDDAARMGEAGSVVVRFDVGTDGSVSNVQILVPSPWPVLNQAAIRDPPIKWQGHFAPGPLRRFKITLKYAPPEGH